MSSDYQVRKVSDKCVGEYRNVFVFSGASGALLAGIWQNGGVTVDMFYEMLDSVLVFDTRSTGARWAIFNESGERLLRSDASILLVGIYHINCSDGTPCAVTPTDAQHHPRVKSVGGSAAPHVTFKTRLLERDQGCVLSGHLARGEGAPFTAIHVFPVARQIDWEERGYANYIQDTHPSIGENKIHSVQNGMLLRADIASAWDTYMLAVHPETHKLIYFTRFMSTPHDGQVINFDHCAAHERPLDCLLREHWRQCLLANVKAAGSKPEDFDIDSDPGEADFQDGAE
ncbi:hypothetical protein BOTBODRAFT_169157 [Botryobasidium botryosum FD-172 SS1]|uniref:Uncharacterized protein n=1 Tax=Botryobasidium botryosum (strain FD-172 SS1) TaxID=930990 RepID=A0A067N0E1_BOTB1|nr:hypothetical protein BOTBODRAFT_169157 [Botryobasidium botryosum FD-172 SS1]